MDGAWTAAVSEAATTRRRLAILAACTVLLFATVAGVLWDLVTVPEDFDRLSRDVQFMGWPVVATQALGAGLLGILALRLGRAVQLHYRDLETETPHTRTAVLAAVAPGLLAAFGMSLAVPAAVRWSSSHTPAAQHADAVQRALLAESRTHPLEPPAAGPAAPAALSGLLLTPAALGNGWYPETTGQPYQPALRAMPARFRALPVARVDLVRAHRTASGWATNGWVSETVWQAPDTATSLALQRYLQSQDEGRAGTALLHHDGYVAELKVAQSLPPALPLPSAASIARRQLAGS